MTVSSQATVTGGNALHESPALEEAARLPLATCRPKAQQAFTKKQEGCLGCGVPLRSGVPAPRQAPSPGSSTRREVPVAPGCENQLCKQPSATLIAQPVAVIIGSRNHLSLALSPQIQPIRKPQHSPFLSPGNMPIFRHVHFTCH